jgi:hypothetical protein
MKLKIDTTAAEHHIHWCLGASYESKDIRDDLMNLYFLTQSQANALIRKCKKQNNANPNKNDQRIPNFYSEMPTPLD